MKLLIKQIISFKRGMICLSKVSRIVDHPPAPEDNFVFINTLSWFPNNFMTIGDTTIKSYEVTPYGLRDEQGRIFENYYQFSKCYKHLYTQHQIYRGIVTWSHPEEVHVDDNGFVLPSYWYWRQKGMSNPYPVRYPNGYHGRHECICSFWEETPGEWKQLNYRQARKTIYCHLYRDLIQKTSAYQELKKLHDTGINLQFIDVDVPTGNTIVTQELYDKYLSDTTCAFGHTWSLAALLLGLEPHLD